MYYLASVCCTCLQHADTLIDLSDTDCAELQFIRKFELCSFIFIVRNLELNQPVFMCEPCCKYLRTTCNFIQRCRRNCAIFRSYVGQLKSVSDELPNRYFDVSVEISTRDTDRCATAIANPGDRSVLTGKDTNTATSADRAWPELLRPTGDKENAEAPPPDSYDGIITNFAFETFVEMQQNAEGPAPVVTAAAAAAVAKRPAESGGREARRSASARRAARRWAGLTMLCRECGRPVKEYNFKRHLLTHADVKPYECTECSRFYTRADHLHNHNRRHHRHRHNGWPVAALWARREECPVCRTLFATHKLLRDHLIGHYQCR